MTFDLEKARAADEALPYPLDAKEIWISRKGQMHINPPNAPSIFFTLSDICEVRNLFHGQAAEIERLRSAIRTYREREESAFSEIEMKDEFLTRQNARINELEADLEQSERVIEARLEVIDQQAARIKELEADNQNLVTLNKSLMNNDWILRDNNRKYRKRAQKAELLNKELKSKIGPDADAKPRVWQITDEREEALHVMGNMKTLIVCPHCKTPIEFTDIPKYMAVLRGMLEEADHDKP